MVGRTAAGALGETGAAVTAGGFDDDDAAFVAARHRAEVRATYPRTAKEPE